MKHFKKILFIALLLTIFWVAYSAPLWVEKTEVIDSKTLKVTLSGNPNMPVGEINAEVTILNDIKLRGAFMSDTSAKQVEIFLEDAIEPSTNYSLLTLLGAEGSIDFTTWIGVEWYTSTNISSTNQQDIDSIEILDDRTILVTYLQDLTSSSFEYKLLAENEVTSIKKPDFDTPDLMITVESDFKSEQEYILMFIDMQDVNGDYIEFDTGIYDFSTPVLEEKNGEIPLQGTGTLLDNSQEETASGSMAVTDGNIDLQAASEDTSLEQDITSNNMEDVAMGATTTPDTGAETWILVMLTLVINSFYYFTRRKKLQTA